jgi:hypothetical protein
VPEFCLLILSLLSINRADLRSVSATPSTSADSDIAEDVRVRLDRALGEVIETNAGVTNDQAHGAKESEDHEDAVEFRLFGSNAGHAIKIRSPSPRNKEPGFLGPPRPLSYYFTGELTEASKQKLIQAAISGRDVLKISHSRWYGCALPWKVISGEGSESSGIGVDASRPHADVRKKKSRPGKKYRIALRKKAASEKEKKEIAQKQAQEKDDYLREKRTRKNRERQLKRRAKEKAKKAEVETIQE